ncbi:MAG: type IV pilus assembly protein PilM, partial [bacterium]|nr:type IV pilus assembly protein PilM [bacterium]
RGGKRKSSQRIMVSFSHMSFFNDLFAKKEQSVLGVDIGSSSLKVVQLRKDHGKAVLETYGELALGPYAGGDVGQATNLSPEQITETLKDLLREAKVTTKNCGVSIPYSRSLLTLVNLPYRQDPKEQKTVIEFEARKYIPIPMSEVQLDWFIVPETDPSQNTVAKSAVEVLIVAVHNDELTLLQNIMTGAGLAASFYEIEIFSTIRAVVDEPVKPVMVLDVGAASTKAYVVERRVVALSHAISAGSQDITRAIAISGNVSIAQAEALKKEQGIGGDSALGSPELVFSRIFSEARRVLMQYETGHQKSITSIVLTGGGGVTKELGAYAKNIFSIDVRVADPFAKTEAPAFMRTILEEIGPEFAVAVGLALRKLDEI